MPDQVATTFVHVEEDGQVSFDFEGHVHAEGLDLTAGTSTSPPDDRKIRWLRESDGALVAELGAYEGGAWFARAHSLSGDQSATLSMIAEDSGGFGAKGRLVASASEGEEGTEEVTILRGGHVSSFVQMENPIGTAKQVAYRAIKELTVTNLNLPSINAHTGAEMNVPGSVGPGDTVLLAGYGASRAPRIIVVPQNPVAAFGTIVLRLFNADSIAVDEAAADFRFLVLSRNPP